MDNLKDLDQEAKFHIAVSQFMDLFAILKTHNMERRFAARAIAVAFAKVWGPGTPQLEVNHGKQILH